MSIRQDTSEVVEKITDRSEYKEMNTYPQDGYLKVIDNYLVLKFE